MKSEQTTCKLHAKMQHWQDNAPSQKTKQKKQKTFLQFIQYMQIKNHLATPSIFLGAPNRGVTPPPSYPLSLRTAALKRQWHPIGLD